jgi:23S rRNA (adenine2503-C2)-methyltransferase
MMPLAGLSIQELEKQLSALPRFRAVQIYKWITRGILDFDKMTDISGSLREELKKSFILYSSKIDSCHEDKNTKKAVIKLKDGIKIEAVLLHDNKKRSTACLSSQAGCPAGCVFCKTGSLGFTRNLDCPEIAEQFFHLLALENNEHNVIDNIVIMGMGEPLLNLEQLRKVIAFFTDPCGLNISKRRITVSTCGICDALYDIAENGPYMRMALSLVTADEDLRHRLMPITKTNPLEKIHAALMLFQQNGGGRITFELPLLGGINTGKTDALSVAKFAKGLDLVVNLIPWNPATGLTFEGKPLCEPDREEIKNFTVLLEKHGLNVTIRRRKGRSVMGACGQLGSI